MKSIMRKTIAGISALAMAAALTATTIPAFALEYEAIEEQNFVDSLETTDLQEMAEEMLDEGLSLYEAQELTSMYAASTSTTQKNYPYNNISKLVNSKHYICVIDKNSSNDFSHQFTVYYKYKNVSDAGTEIRSKSRNISGLYTNRSYSPKNESEIANHTLYKGIVSTMSMGAASTSSASFVCAYGFDAENVKSEKEFANSFAYSEYGISSNGQYAMSDLAFETVAVGDVDHDGAITASDAQAIIGYVAGTESLNYTFSDGYTHYSGVTAQVAADYNGDGKVDYTDATAILASLS